MTRLPMIDRQESTPNKYDWRRELRGLVLHIAQGSYEGTIAWQKNPDSNVSSEFVIGRTAGQWAQMMPLTCSGWTQRAGNGYWVATENAGYVADGLSDWQVEANARLLAELYTRYGVPLQVTETPATRGLGHHSMGAENGYDWGHPECPGVKVRSRKQEIVARATQIIEGDDVTPEDIQKIVDGVWAKQLADPADSQRMVSAGGWLRYADIRATNTRAAVEQLTARINELAAAEQARDVELRALLAAHQSGQLSAEEVVARMGEALTRSTASQG